MKPDRNLLRAIVIILGPMILLSYVWGFSRLENPSLIWGGVPLALQSIYTAWMFVAAGGFLTAFAFWLFFWPRQAVEQIAWPWSPPAPGGHRRLMIALLLILIPSMLWIELTIFHLQVAAFWSAALVIINLLLVALGSLIWLALSWSACKSKIGSGIIAVLVGMIAFNLQTVLLDGIIWILLFPW